jgi:hypothetical protein
MPRKIKAKKKKVKHNIKVSAKASNKTNVVVKIDQRKTTKGRAKPSRQIPTIISGAQGSYPIYLNAPSYQSAGTPSYQSVGTPIKEKSNLLNEAMNLKFEEPPVEFGMLYSNPLAEQKFNPSNENISEVSSTTMPLANNPLALKRVRRTNVEIYAELLTQNGYNTIDALDLATSTEPKLLKDKIAELKSRK